MAFRPKITSIKICKTKLKNRIASQFFFNAPKLVIQRPEDLQSCECNSYGFCSMVYSGSDCILHIYFQFILLVIYRYRFEVTPTSEKISLMHSLKCERSRHVKYDRINTKRVERTNITGIGTQRLCTDLPC